MEPLNIAVVGLGRMGKRHVHTLVYRVPRARVVAVCTTDKNEIEWATNNEEYKDFGIQVYSNYDEMLGHRGLHAVWISTSTDVHASQSLAAIAKGIHTLCEKPLSTDLAEAQYVVEAAKCNPSVKVMAGFSRRFDASYRDAAEKIYQQEAIGIFVDCAIHNIDLSLWYLGNPVPKACWAAGTLQHHPELKDLSDVDNVVGVVEFRGGKIAYFYCSRTQAHGHDVSTEITETNGKLMVNVIPNQNNVVLADKLGMKHEVQPEYWQRFEDAFALEANEIVEAIVKNKELPLSLGTGITVMKIGQALQQALLTGEVTRVNESGERLN
ncbi:hypothetical protein PENARI_c018G03608 [Penicillium arizonense]|uniref:Gfo/Idh/MocA-like oxidoreductase N-terminal domain-containing protein n=1 Tax=Penicillium arizonense TaxID=1835702 RepID=A0A1F5LAJ3_PENAI|nr:hypothetical protein PENARI_c018G03608 [Penicillium arizonense]OGE50076.1 hypothetical protein PENARI_c018G03608 [Penicillium arizonense]